MKLQGRTRDLIKASDGRMVHGVAFNGIVLKFPWVDRYQVIQVDEKELILNVATSSDVSDLALGQLKREVIELCGLDVCLMLNTTFESTAGQKNRVIISRLEGM